jgi:hypothetical protein
MQVQLTKADALALLRAFRGTRDGFAKQYGVRKAQLAIQLWDANRPVAEEAYWQARAQVSAAKAA